jgi:hypothetical protein
MRNGYGRGLLELSLPAGLAGWRIVQRGAKKGRGHSCYDHHEIGRRIFLVFDAGKSR